MPRREARLYLPYDQWPAVDRLLWERTISSDDPFADAAGASLADASQRVYWFAWRRWLGFLAINEPAALAGAPTERLASDRSLLILPKPTPRDRSRFRLTQCTRPLG